MAGYPRRQADALIRETEAYRGLYAGTVGTVDPTGDGLLCVAIRSALLRGKRCHLYAGAGIVEGSNIDSESIETVSKTAAVLDVLRGAP